MQDETVHELSGQCHCGSVSFRVRAKGELVVHECNCSICRLSGFLHLIVPADDFRLMKGQSSLTEYRFNTGKARHLFCSKCGIKSFYVPRSNPNGFSVNLRCLAVPPGTAIRYKNFDGQNWERNAHELEHLA